MCAAKPFRKTVVALPVIFAIVLSFFIVPDGIAKPLIFEKNLRVVVIDPGHGGNNAGARGPNGTFEKTVTLHLAQIIAHKLEPDYRIVLTRNDDYGLDSSSRTAVANHAKAEIFISLHTGSSFVHSISGTAVYFYQPFQESALTTKTLTPKPLAESNPTVGWEMIQTKYRASSEKLAKLIQSRLNNTRQTPHIKAQGVPLLVLEGADMPAVAIEIGNLSNASEEKLMSDPQFLSEIAQDIIEGIVIFLTEKPK